MPHRLLFALALCLLAPLAAIGEDEPQRPKRPGPRAPVYRDEIAPNWFDDNSRFWYRLDLRGQTKEFILVDAVKGTREPAFDHKKLAAALSKAAGKEYAADRLPFDRIEFVEQGKAVRFSAAGQGWKCDLTSYECTSTENAPKDKAEKSK